MTGRDLTYLFLGTTIQMVQAQVQAYEIEEKKLPADISALKIAGYLEETSCPNGDAIQITAEGKVERTTPGST
ncbi:hypothetical protein GCM10009865_14410 [Aeromicrobium ponti]|uniref:Uncharacterized protein n=2 Tax=Cytobacillus oceanisediminis TaxID=665099 RepID=A0A562K125_9BACI|nr:hypothetical protein IQ19_01334 [Cytobacillus oceanisediminis]